MTKHWLKDGEAAVLRAQVSAQLEEDAGRKKPETNFDLFYLCGFYMCHLTNLEHTAGEKLF